MATQPATSMHARLTPLAGARARSPQDKDLRRSHLVQAAMDLFVQSDFDGVTIANVAHRAGVAKGTAYLYFNSKEAMFLALVCQELSAWEVDLNQGLSPASTLPDPADIPLKIARSLAHRPVLCRLLVLLHSVIEPHLDLETALTFKRFLRDFVTRISALLVNRVPGLQANNAVTLILQIHALVISVTQLASPPAVIASAFEQDPSLHSMRVAFEPFLADTLGTLMRGMLVQPR